MRVVSLVLITLCSVVQAQDIIVAEGGVARSVIVVSVEAPAPDKHAAEELATFLSQVTNSKFNIVHEIDPAEQNIAVGTIAAKLLDPAFNLDGLGQDGIVMRTIGDDLILAGNGPRGTLYAVYTFLEDVVGCRWWTSKASSIPAKDRLEVQSLSIRHTPSIEQYRETYWLDDHDPDWSVRNKINGKHREMGPSRGGRLDAYRQGYTFFTYLPPDRYFASHPEWYTEINGKRAWQGGQLCLTNDAMRAEFVKNFLEDVRNQPEIWTAFVAPSEVTCRCKECNALNEREGTPSGSLVYFLNGVAAEVAKELPNLKISTIVHEYAQVPPKTLRVHDNVIIWLGTGASFAHPIAHDQNRVFRERLEGWSEKAQTIYIWDYVTNFAAYVCPHPNLRTLGPNARFFAYHNVKGVFSQGSRSVGSEWAELRAWVIAKLMWDASRDPDSLIAEFLNGYYGPAAPHLNRYIDLMHDSIAATNESLAATSPASGRWLSLATLTQALTILNEAQAAVHGETELSQRVELARLPVLYVFLMRWDMLREELASSSTDWPLGDSIQVEYEAFSELAKRHSITDWSENRARDSFQSVIDRVALADGDPPPGCENISRAKWTDVQEGSLNLKDQPLAARVDDLLASNGSAVYMPGNHEIPAVQKQLWRVFLLQASAQAGRPVRGFASIRCELAAPSDGIVFRYGVGSDIAPGAVSQHEVKAHSVKDSAYHTYDLGQFTESPGWYSAWIAPAGNPSVKGIWIDRIWFVEEPAP